MARFEKAKSRMPRGRPKSSSTKKGYSRDRPSTRGPRAGPPRGRSRREDGPKREFGTTKVICSECKKECEVPFKPTSNKPIYCDKCFAKRARSSSDKSSDKDLDIINEKLNKIMRALNIK